MSSPESCRGLINEISEVETVGTVMRRAVVFGRLTCSVVESGQMIVVVE